MHRSGRLLLSTATLTSIPARSGLRTSSYLDVQIDKESLRRPEVARHSNEMSTTVRPQSPFRNDVDFLTSRLAEVDTELADLRVKAAEYVGIEERLRRLEEERNDLQRRLDARVPAGSLVDELRIASPCNERWDAMVGDERTRFCKKCEKNVHDVSAMTRVEAETFLRSVAGGTACVRFFRRDDGTVINSDCPVGARRKRVKRLVLSIVGTAGLAAGGALAFWRYEEEASHQMVGEIRTSQQEVMGGTGAPIASDAPPPVKVREVMPIPPSSVHAPGTAAPAIK
jgi:hypothetical protein